MPRVDWLIVGLGNPGPKYASTRHNIGFAVCKQLADRADLGRAKDKYAGRFIEGRLTPGGPKVAILAPQTFMNESGRSVGPARGELRVAPEHIVVVHDEIDLPFGKVETRLGGGLAGHNGLKSIRDALGTADFYRVRVGVGRPDSNAPSIVADYVLSPFAEPQTSVNTLTDRATTAVFELTANAA